MAVTLMAMAGNGAGGRQMLWMQARQHTLVSGGKSGMDHAVYCGGVDGVGNSHATSNLAHHGDWVGMDHSNPWGCWL